jgi:hypothetical protein
MVYGKAISNWVKQAGKSCGQARAAAGADFVQKSLIFGLDKFSDMVRINP